MKNPFSFLPIRVLFGINLAVGLVLFYFLAFVQEVDPGQFPWMMNFLIYAGGCYMMVVLVEKQTNPYHALGGYLGSFAILLGSLGYLLFKAL